VSPTSPPATSPTMPSFVPARTPQRGAADDEWVIAALALPLLAVLGIYLWMQSLRVIDAIRTNPQQTLSTVLATTLVLTGICVALDAAKIGIGGPDDLDRKGRARANGPAHWGLFVVFLFVIGYPSYLAIRSRRGVHNYLLAGIAVMIIFSFGTIYFYAALNQALHSRGFSPQ
jgi:putative Mn2+ efflux pump MntP